MEFTIERSTLAEAVARAARSLPARSTVPVLGGLLLDARAGRLRISGFDHEAFAEIDTPADTAVDGRVLVLGRRLADICKVLPEGRVGCALEGSRFTVDGGGTRFGLSTLPLEEYPALPTLPAVRGQVDAAEFAAALGQVVIAAGRDDTLPVLTGVQLRTEGETLTLSASDRYRYAVRSLPWKPEPDAAVETLEIVLPGRRLTDLARAVSRSGTLRVGLDPHGGSGLVSFETAGMRSALRLLDGRLPRYDKLFSLDGPAVAEVEREPLTEAVRRVGVVAEPNSPIRMDFSVDGAVLLQAGYEDDVASQRMAATLAASGDVSVAFNPQYLLDALQSFTSQRIRFELLGPGQRALLGGVPGSGESDATEVTHRHLLMSVRQLS
ncbi:DNA polymerase III subunit beta [Streptomyces sp. UH6]|uniref:DNA polymerase III subunit beta n=1 Tax=Streptomyces sp. UH6 TaxID=2748379 RepID=UPI0015D49934|nr:DNA polymerase III subunit beta [Streptomyces sp. UH6]NYV75657.1 DNA polymerase III subunit beta [Streptomyces sp. UH6]